MEQGHVISYANRGTGSVAINGDTRASPAMVPRLDVRLKVDSDAGPAEQF